LSLNLSRSILSFTATPQAAGNGSRYNYIHSSGFPCLERIQLYTRGGLFLCDLGSLAQYMYIVTKRSTKKEDGNSWDSISGYVDVFQPRTTLDALTLGAAATAAPYLNIFSSTDNAATISDNFYDFIPGGSNTATPVIMYQIPLSRILNTISSIDKNQFFNDTVMIRLTWNPSNKVGFWATSQTDPTAGVAPMVNSITITNLFLYAAIELNQEIYHEVIQHTNRGDMKYHSFI
jgi:hypothetical protein